MGTSPESRYTLERRATLLGARVVKTLTSELKGKYHHVYFDNYFTGLEDLKKDKIYACGTAIKDRKGFPDLL